MGVRSIHVGLLARVLAVVFVVGGCTMGGASSSAGVEPTFAADSASNTPFETDDAPRPSPAAIVGEWVGIHDCERISDLLEEAGLEAFIEEQVLGNGLVPGVDSESDLLDPSAPCAEAVPQKHSHFFTADGLFGSKDFLGQQVDDGTYRLEGADVVVINGTPFRYRIQGDTLLLEPPEIDASSCTTDQCRFEAAWALMVAMPGMPWARGTITAD